MNRVLDVNFHDRTATVEAGITNLGISNAVASAKFFYAPDPSSQLACTIGGNIAMNSGGAHCLKYGVTANNVLKVKMVLMNGEIVELGGDYLDPQGYDLLGFAIGSEGQLRRSSQRQRCESCARRRARGRCSSASAPQNPPAPAWPRSSRMASFPLRSSSWTNPRSRICDDFAKAGYPRDAEAMLIVEVEGSASEIEEQISRVKEIANRFEPTTLSDQPKR